MEKRSKEPPDTTAREDGSDTPRKRGEFDVFGIIQRDPPFFFQSAGRIKRADRTFETLESPKGVVQKRTDVDPAFLDAAKEFRLPFRIAFDKAKRLLRNRHIKAITAFRLLPISFGHLIEVGKHEVGCTLTTFLLI